MTTEPSKRGPHTFLGSADGDNFCISCGKTEAEHLEPSQAEGHELGVIVDGYGVFKRQGDKYPASIVYEVKDADGRLWLQTGGSCHAHNECYSLRAAHAAGVREERARFERRLNEFCSHSDVLTIRTAELAFRELVEQPDAPTAGEGEPCADTGCSHRAAMGHALCTEHQGRLGGGQDVRREAFENGPESWERPGG